MLCDQGIRLRRLPATVEHQRAPIARNSPAADVIDAGVVALAKVSHPQEESLVWKQFRLMANALAISTRQIAGKGSGQSPQRPSTSTRRARGARPPQQQRHLVALPRGEHRVTPVGDEERLPANQDASPHRVAVA